MNHHHPFLKQVQILVAVESRFYALNDTVLMCATQKDWTTWIYAQLNILLQGIYRQQHLIKHMICNVRYCHQMVICSKTPRQIKSAECKALKVDCFAKS